MTRPEPFARLRDMPGLGPKSQAMLIRAGITTPQALRAVGAVQAYLAVKRVDGSASLNLLWALEGALTGQQWTDVAREGRVRLLLALDEAERGTWTGSTAPNRGDSA